jgi:uncharacterized membrane protein
MKTVVFVIVLGGALVTFGCGSNEEDLPEVNCSAQTAPGFGEVTAFQKCTRCHSSTLGESARSKAPDDVNFDTLDAAKAHANEAAHEVYAGDMPPKDSGTTLTDAEKQQLYLWALCGTKP